MAGDPRVKTARKKTPKPPANPQLSLVPIPEACRHLRPTFILNNGGQTIGEECRACGATLRGVGVCAECGDEGKLTRVDIGRELRFCDAECEKAAKRRREGKDKPGRPSGVPVRPTASLFDSVLSMFSERWEQRKGVRYVDAGGGRPALGRVLQKLTADEMPALSRAIDCYLASKDDFVLKQGHSLAYMCSSFPKWWSRAAGQPDGWRSQ